MPGRLPESEAGVHDDAVLGKPGRNALANPLPQEFPDIRDHVASVVRPVRELQGFTKVHLEPGAERTVAFMLGPRDLGFYNRDMQWVVEPGVFAVWVAPSSTDGVEVPKPIRPPSSVR